MADVYLYIYDISHGMARMLSHAIVGQHFDGIWHTGVVVYNIEYYFGQEGISNCRPGTLSIGKPIEKKLIGSTTLTKNSVNEHLTTLSKSLFAPGKYDLFKHNCNNFSEHFIKLLTNKPIPAYIINLPLEFLQTPLGASFKSILEGVSNVYGESNNGSKDSFNPQQHNDFKSTLIPFKPIVYDEPLSSEVSAEELDQKFSIHAEGLTAQWEFETRDLLKNLSKITLKEEIFAPHTYAVLNLSHRANFTQSEAICEIIRLAIWRFPDILLAFLTEPLQNLHKLADSYPPEKGQISRSLYYCLDASKACLLCNVLFMTYDWDLSSMNFIPLEPVVKMCIRLIDFDADARYRSPEHELIGLSLAMNISLCSVLDESNALELGACIFHIISMKKSFKFPRSASYILRTVYCLTKRFESIVNVAKALEIGQHTNDVLSQAESFADDESSIDSKHESPWAIDKKIALELISLLSS